MSKRARDVPPLRANKPYMEYLWKLAEDLGALDDMKPSQRQNFRKRAVADPYPDFARALHARVMLRRPDTPPPFLRIRSEKEGRLFWMIRLTERLHPVLFAEIFRRLELYLDPEIQKVEADKVLARLVPMTENSALGVPGFEEEEDHAWIRSWAEALEKGK